MVYSQGLRVQCLGFQGDEFGAESLGYVRRIHLPPRGWVILITLNPKPLILNPKP